MTGKDMAVCDNIGSIATLGHLCNLRGVKAQGKEARTEVVVSAGGKFEPCIVKMVHGTAEDCRNVGIH